jgi:hypothetical protein
MAEKKIMEETRRLALSCHMMIRRYIGGSVSVMLRHFPAVTEAISIRLLVMGNQKLKENKNRKRIRKRGRRHVGRQRRLGLK